MLKPQQKNMIATRQRQQLQHHARALQRRATAMSALFMTILFLCIEHIRAFANQYRISAQDAMVLASAASSLPRKFSSTCPILGDSLKKNLPKTSSFVTSPGRASNSNGSSTLLNAWSIPTIAMPSMPAMPTSKDIPLHTLGSWYSEVDPTTKPPVYDDEYDNSYSFSSPTDDWPSMSPEMEETNNAVRSHMRRGPLKTLRSVAGRFKDIIAQ